MSPDRSPSSASQRYSSPSSPQRDPQHFRSDVWPNFCLSVSVWLSSFSGIKILVPVWILSAFLPTGSNDLNEWNVMPAYAICFYFRDYWLCLGLGRLGSLPQNTRLTILNFPSNWWHTSTIRPCPFTGLQCFQFHSLYKHSVISAPDLLNKLRTNLMHLSLRWNLAHWKKTLVDWFIPYCCIPPSSCIHLIPGVTGQQANLSVWSRDDVNDGDTRGVLLEASSEHMEQIFL